MKVKIALFALLITFASSGVNAQNENRLPAFDFTPQSPSAAAFSKYGDIPVDLSTGVPKIQIPLFTVTSGPISVPLSISYHASGIRVRDIASEVGLGWVLNVGGVLTRTILGNKDEYQTLFGKAYPNDSTVLTQDIQNAYNTNTWYAKSHEIFSEIRFRGSQDAYSDRYYYSLGNGESGVFRKNFANDSLMMIPYSPTKPDINADGITLTTIDGNRYFFKKNFRDLWYLTKIVSHNKTDSVLFYSHRETFNFGNYSQIAYYGGTEVFSVVDSDPHTCSYIDTRPALQRNDVYYSAVMESDDVVIFDSIVSTGVVIKFSYMQDRQDRSFTTTTKSRINKVEVFSKVSGELVKAFSFFHSYFGFAAGDKRLRLDSIRAGVGAEEKHSFRYNSMSLPSYPEANWGAFNQTGSAPEDYWGYNNGSSSTLTIPRPFYPYGADKKPSEQSAQACIIEEIKYPTGGRTVFEFELNKVTPQDGITTTDGKTGGLRVKRTSDYADDQTPPVIKTYEYSIPSSPNYTLEGLFNYREDLFTSFDFSDCGQTPPVYSWSNVAVAHPFSPLLGDSRLPIIYSLVTEYQGDQTNNTGKTVYNFDEPSSFPRIDFEIVDSDSRFLNMYQFDRGIHVPVLYNKQEFKNEAGQYKLVREISNKYVPYKVRKFQTGFNLGCAVEFSHLVLEGEPFDPASSGFQFYIAFNTDYLNKLIYSNTWGYTTSKRLKQTDVWDYTGANASVNTTTTYEYNQYLQVAKKTLKASDGKDLVVEYKYAADFKTIEPYATMVNQRNFLSPVVEQFDYRNANLLEITRTNYSQWTSTFIAPATVEHKMGTSPFETVAHFHAYDAKGNPITISKGNDYRKSYVWGYNKTYPIAEIVNADATQVAYSSFEEAAEESWTINGNYQPTNDGSSPTGQRCYNLDRGSLYKGGLSVSAHYIVSYWQKAGASVSVSGPSSEVISSAPIGEWTYVTRKINGVNSLAISGSGFIDEVRLYPADSQIATYTYSPSVGITSVTDDNGITNYHEYDNQGRLKHIKDNLGNVVKTYTYNYRK